MTGARLALARGEGARGRFPVAPKSERTIDGHVFDSKREAIRYGELKLLERAGVISKLKVQPSWNVEIGGKHFCRYTADFEYLYHAERVVEDCKSTGTAKDTAYRLRRKAAELAHGITITEYVV